MAYYSNIDVFLSIAEESYATMREATEQGRALKEGGGYVITWDASRTSFKSACIAATFSAMYFEALVYLVALRRFGSERAKKIDRMLYEERLAALGVHTPELLELAKGVQLGRKELVHEKALELGRPMADAPRFAQDLAEEAIQSIRGVRSELVAP